ncbi:MAG TPA: hypothetical protein VEJ39_06670 [Candidatus Acidoferrales bacterium]|nr:hypothetical protein [Candidatus Acidoferrales bacterium]
MILVAKLALGALGTIVTAGAIVSSEGFISVRVHEKKPDGTHLTIYVPALLADEGLRFVPKEKLQDASAQIRPWLPTIHAAIEELRSAGDTTLVEVREPAQHVTVAARGGAIVVDVDDDGNTVHVSTPLRTIDSAIDQIAAAGPNL